MTDLRKAAQKALEAWDIYQQWPLPIRPDKEFDTLRAALAQPEQDPVAWIRNEGGLFGSDWTPLYTNSPQRKPMTDMAIERAYDELLSQPMREQDKRVIVNFARAIEKAHGIGGDV
jgi:hypothetical protein